jgi:Icc-related predicted phosphoesterase
MIRVAAVGDLHFGQDSAGTFRPKLQQLSDQADVLLLAGDLTRFGDPDEANVLAAELEGLTVPVVTVLGNHDYHSDRNKEVRQAIEAADVVVLDGEGIVLEIGGLRVGIAGTKGFGGGFAGASGSEFGEPEMKAFVAHTRGVSDRLSSALGSLSADVKIALLHYSPIKGTLQGERLEIYPFLGSYLLAEAIDRVGADLVLHGHAHHGTEKGVTPGDIHVRNVALPVIRHAYNLYCLRDGEVESAAPTEAFA